MQGGEHDKDVMAKIVQSSLSTGNALEKWHSPKTGK